MSEFVLHPQASADLDEIWGYIAADNIEQPTGSVKKSTNRSSRLSRFLT